MEVECVQHNMQWHPQMQIPNVLTLSMTISATNNCWFLESEVVLTGVLFA